MYGPRVDPLLKCPFIACLQQKVIFGIPNIRAALNKTNNNNITEYHASLNMNENGHSNISKTTGKQKKTY